MARLNGAPTEVIEVYEALVKSAVNAFGESGVDAANAYEAKYGDHTEWRVGSNFEDGHPTMIFRKSSWYYRSPWSGEDTKMRAGFAEAIGNASIFFTG